MRGFTWVAACQKPKNPNPGKQGMPQTRASCTATQTAPTTMSGPHLAGHSALHECAEHRDGSEPGKPPAVGAGWLPGVHRTHSMWHVNNKMSVFRDGLVSVRIGRCTRKTQPAGQWVENAATMGGGNRLKSASRQRNHFLQHQGSFMKLKEVSLSSSIFEGRQYCTALTHI